MFRSWVVVSKPPPSLADIEACFAVDGVVPRATYKQKKLLRHSKKMKKQIFKILLYFLKTLIG